MISKHVTLYFQDCMVFHWFYTKSGNLPGHVLKHVLIHLEKSQCYHGREARNVQEKQNAGNRNEQVYPSSVIEEISPRILDHMGVQGAHLITRYHRGSGITPGSRDTPRMCSRSAPVDPYDILGSYECARQPSDHQISPGILDYPRVSRCTPNVLALGPCRSKWKARLVGALLTFRSEMHGFLWFCKAARNLW